MIPERRRVPRYRIDTAIAVNGGSGRTIDLSSNSVYFETGCRLAPGEEVGLVLPFEHAGPNATVRCKAQILRVDQRGEMYGVAATYEPVAFSVSA